MTARHVIQSTGGYWEHLGITGEASAGGSVCTLTIGEHHLNANGIAHGGVVSGLIDSAAGLAVRSVRDVAEIADRPHATSDLHVSYLSGATGTLTARARVVKQGRTAIFTDVDVLDEAGRLVAKGIVTFVIRHGG